MTAAAVKPETLRLPSVKSTRAPLLRVIAPVNAEAGIDALVYELVAFNVAAFATVTALDAIDPVEPIFNVPVERFYFPMEVTSSVQVINNIEAQI